MIFIDEKQSVSLDGHWRFAYSDSPHPDVVRAADIESAGLDFLPCKVPGNFELDLQSNGIIDEPFYGMNIAGLTRYENCHIWYSRKFQASEKNGYDAQLVFQGLDCFADIFLNGKLIGSCDNMLIEHIIDVSDVIEEENEILVHIRPALEEAKKHHYPPSLFALGSNYDSLYTRKAPHMYGWDIMPRAVSAGIWRPVHLRLRPVERLEDVYLETTAITEDRTRASLLLSYKARTRKSGSDDYRVRIEGRCGESTFSQTAPMLFDAGRIQVELDQPKLWWPKGRGDADLYDIAVSLIKDGAEIDRQEFTHGIRTVRLERTSTTDAEGSGEFCFHINGEKIFVLGSNWVPADAYHSRDAERIPRMMELVDDIGCSMLRCWGGNVYEDDLFYQTCDRLGVMVWQDFAMACGLYPQDEDFCRKLANEVRSAVRRLRQHPSIVLWSGDNECDYAWSARVGNPNKNLLTRKVIPAVLQDEDPGRPYLPSSPCIDEEAYRVGGSRLTEDHLWGPRDYYKSEFYQTALCHFASEIGYHGCPSPDSIRKFISPDKIWPYQDNEEWTLHSTSPVPEAHLYDFRVELMAKQVKVLFGEVPDNLEDFAFASQASQGEAKKFFIEMFRTAKWRRTGIIWWNLIDGWPQFSDAVVDYYFDKKLAYHFIKRVQAPLCLSLREPKEDVQELVACNDNRQDLDIDYVVRDIDTEEILAQNRAVVAGDSVVVLAEIPYSADRKRFYVIEWKGSGLAGKNHYLAGGIPFDLTTYRTWLTKAGLMAQ